MRSSNYSVNVVVTPTSELDNSNLFTRCTDAINLNIGVFLCLLFYGRRVRDIERCADALVSRFVNPCTATTPILDKIDGSSNYSQGAIIMANNRLCAENSALLNILHKHINADELEELNINLHNFTQSCLDNRPNRNLNQAFYDIKIRYGRVVKGGDL